MQKILIFIVLSLSSIHIHAQKSTMEKAVDYAEYTPVYKELADP